MREEPIYQIWIRTLDSQPNPLNNKLKRTRLLTNYTKLEYKIRYNNVGGWVLDMPDEGNPDAEEMRAVFNQGAGYGGITVVRRGLKDDDQARIVFSGPIRGFTATGDYTSDTGATIQFFGVDDTGYLSTRLAMVPDIRDDPPFAGQFIAPALDMWGFWLFPEPTTPPTPSPTRATSQIIQNLVQFNIGNAAPFNLPGVAQRRIPFLDIAPYTVFGPTSYRVRTRYQNLLEKIQEVASYVTPLSLLGVAFKIIQTDADRLSFVMFDPRTPAHNKTDTVIISKGFGNLGGYKYTLESPSINYSVVAGQGEGLARFFEHRGVQSDPNSVQKYGLREGFLDRRDVQYEDPVDGGTPAQQRQYNNMVRELNAAMDVQLREEGEVIELEVDALNVPPFLFFSDYNVGDQISVVIKGEHITGIVRDVTVTLTKEEGEVIKPTIGTQVVGSNFRLYQQFNQERQKVKTLEISQ